MAWCSELLAFSSSSRSDGDGSPEPVGRPRSRQVRGPMLADRRAGGAGRSADYTSCASRLSAARSAESTDTRQPCARGSRKSEPWAARQPHARTRSTSLGQRPCGARGFMAARRATRCCARFGGRSPHRLHYQKNHHHRNRCRPICTSASSRTTTKGQNLDQSSGGRATSTRATPWCRPVACAGPRIGMEGEAPRRSCVEVPTAPIKECPRSQASRRRPCHY